ncbi:MAG TPA: ATP-binding protein [Lutibacter sp.]
MENLQKLKLVGTQGIITNAAWLLFAKENTGYNVHLGRFKTPSTIIDDRMLNGTLFDVVEDTMRYLIGQIKVAFEIEGMPTQRTEIFEYPLPALREIVLNTIIHRDYLSPIDIQIKIFDQEITFYNPGTLYGNLTVEELKKDNYQANARNKLLAEAFYLTGDIEKYGSGFIRIRKEIKEYPTMKMAFNEIPNGFLASLSYAKQKTSLVHDNVVDNVTENVTEDVIEDVTDNRRNAIVELIKKDHKITTTEIANAMGVVRRTIARDIELLKRSGVIVRVGSDKHGYWEAVDRKEP